MFTNTFVIYLYIFIDLVLKIFISSIIQILIEKSTKPVEFCFDFCTLSRRKVNILIINKFYFLLKNIFPIRPCVNNRMQMRILKMNRNYYFICFVYISLYFSMFWYTIVVFHNIIISDPKSGVLYRNRNEILETYKMWIKSILPGGKIISQNETTEGLSGYFETE